MIRKLTTVSVLGLVLASGGNMARAESAADAARADIEKTVGFVPEFVKAIPDVWLPGVWEEMKGFEINPKTALSGQGQGADRPGRGGAGRQPRHRLRRTRSARGPTAPATAEVGEAVAIAALARHWSTFFNGIQLDEAKFRAEIAKLRREHHEGDGRRQPPPPGADRRRRRASALKDIEQIVRLRARVHEEIPPEAAAGAWLQMRDVEMNPKTALPGKTKSLISLAVASQVPCRYCVIADTEFAKLEGATDARDRRGGDHGRRWRAASAP